MCQKYKKEYKIKSIGTYLFLKWLQLFGRQRISLRYNRNEIYFVAQLLHKLDVQTLETVASWLNEIETAVHTIIAIMRLAELRFFNQVFIEFFLYEIHDLHTTGAVVEKIAESRRIDQVKKQIHFVFDQMNLWNIDSCRLARFERWTRIVLIVYLAVEQLIYEGWFACVVSKVAIVKARNGLDLI